MNGFMKCSINATTDYYTILALLHNVHAQIGNLQIDVTIGKHSHETVSKTSRSKSKVINSGSMNYKLYDIALG
jgi:hypothetical protein